MMIIVLWLTCLLVAVCSLFGILPVIFKHQSFCCIGFMATGAPTLLYFFHIITMVKCRSRCSYVR